MNEAADVRLRDIERGDELVRHFTARPFGVIPELVKEMFTQTEMWPSRPAPEWSAVDTLAAAIDDVAAEREDSMRFLSIPRLDSDQLNYAAVDAEVLPLHERPRDAGTREACTSR